MNHLKTYCKALNSEIKQTGRSEKEHAEISLRAGRLTMIYRDGALRYISAGSEELLRMIYPAVRVKDWITVAPVFSEEEFIIKPDSFRIKFSCHYKSEEVDFTARYEMTGSNDNSLVISMDGMANRNFLKNRIGLCILHPIESCAGATCDIEHVDGSSERSFFPVEISPHQVFRDIKSMHWQIDKIKCSIDLEGDVFETEDQRNWTDASFKTYSTPLSIPYPVLIEKGTRVYQRVKFRSERISGKTYRQPDTTVIKLFPGKPDRLPSIGIYRTANNSVLHPEEIKVLTPLHFDHYRVDLHLFEPDWQDQAELACHESSVLGWPVEFALFTDDDAVIQVRRFIKWYVQKKPSVARILLLHRSIPCFPGLLARTVIPLLKEVDNSFKIGIGTNANFVQLNRNRPDITGNDFICYSVQPQEHASDDLTLIENLRGQAYTVATARKFDGNKGVIVSPVTLKRRFNANNSMVELPYSGQGLPPNIDSRTMSLFGACWTAGSLKYLCEAGADSVTYFNTTGERGIIQGETGSKWPEHFFSAKGMIFPVYYVFRFLLDNKDLSLVKNTSSSPLVVESLLLTNGTKMSMILVNFTGSVQPVRIEDCTGLFRIRSLSTENFADIASDYRWTGLEGEIVFNPGELFHAKPFSINFISGNSK